MKDNLENFIRSNREDFDQSSPDLKIWAGIEKNLGKPPRRISLWRNLAAAASILLLLGIGTLIGMQINPKNASINSLGDVSLEHQELQQYYESQVKEKTNLLVKYNADHSVQEDLQQLEVFLDELRNELQEAPKGNEEQIVNAMIKNYQDRLNILERVLSRIHSNSKDAQKSTNDEEINL